MNKFFNDTMQGLLEAVEIKQSRKRDGGYVYEVPSEALDNIQPVSKEFLDECKKVREKYEKKNTDVSGISDCLTIGVDFSHNDRDMISVIRRKGDEMYVVNVLTDEEAVEVYNKLIGIDK